MSRFQLLTGGAVPGLACVLLGLLPAEVQAQPHMVWATRLVREVGPRTSYRHTQGPVTWRHARPAGVAADGSTISTRGVVTQSHTDCSGMIDAALRQAYRLSRADMRQWLGASRPLAVHYHDTIVAQRRFQRIMHVRDARPGNIIAIRYARSNAHRDTGHVVLVAGRPHPTRIPGLWGVPIIDQSRSGHGPGNVRPAQGGVGQGTLGVQVHPSGTVAGYRWSPSLQSHFYPQSLQNRHLVIGRIRR